MKHKTQFMNNLPLLNDLRVFMLVARRAGFASAAEELGVSPAFVSKRIALLEQTLNVRCKRLFIRLKKTRQAF